jgi:hypothetical protein
VPKLVFIRAAHHLVGLACYAELNRPAFHRAPA